MVNHHTFWNFFQASKNRKSQPFKPFSSQVHRSRKNSKFPQDLIAKSMARAVQMMERIEKGFGGATSTYTPEMLT